MKRPIENAARNIALRSCGFAAICIVAVELNQMSDPQRALQIGGLLTLGFALTLCGMSLRALHVNYRRTEVWAMLKQSERPQAVLAQCLISKCLRRAYLACALQCATAAAAQLLISLGYPALAPMLA